MSKMTKRRKAINEKVTLGKVYSLTEALDLLKEFSKKLKFIESVDVSINLGIDAKKSEQAVRGATTLPHGTGRTARVAVFAQGDKATAATEAGADRVGFEDLMKAMKEGDLNYDVIIATPDAMRVVGQLGQVLGPRGLMPNPKEGTVTMDVAGAIKSAKSGRARYRTDKNGIIHCAIGKINFEPGALKDNLKALITDLKKLRPTSAKGIYLKKIVLSTTMGPGLLVDHASIN